MTPDQVDFVLVRPRRAENVAAACRALKNMGWRRLRLVGRVEGLERSEARALAYGARDVLDAAEGHSSLAEAVADSHFVVATSGLESPQAWSPRRLARDAPGRVGGGRLAVVFGPEPTGLSTAELALCHQRVRIPADPGHPSLNLAMAVLVVAYELRLEAGSPQACVPIAPATAGALEDALGELERALLAVGYLNPQNPTRVLSELRQLLARAVPTEREVTLLRGLARQVAWAARVARDSKAER